MTYNANIPQATDLISNSQAQILANFSQLNTQFAVDHVAFNTGSGNGDGTHKKITFDNAPAEPNPTGTISNLFPLLVGSAQELFFKNASAEYSGSGKIQLTGPSSVASTGYITLPGGLIFQWKNDTGSNGNSKTYAIDFPNNCFAVLLTKNSSSTSAVVGVNTFTRQHFTLTTDAGGAIAYTMMAIGN